MKDMDPQTEFGGCNELRQTRRQQTPEIIIQHMEETGQNVQRQLFYGVDHLVYNLMCHRRLYGMWNRA